MKWLILIIFCILSLSFVIAITTNDIEDTLIFNSDSTSISTLNNVEDNLIFIIGEYTPPNSTCIYSGSGNWNINCYENCTISNNYNLAGNNITLIGSGTITITSNLSNFKMKLNTGNTCRINLINTKFN